MEPVRPAETPCPVAGDRELRRRVVRLVLPALVVVVVAAGSAESIPRSAGAGDLVLVSLAGVTTAVPLILFAFAAARVPFTVLGPLQYLVPTINFLLGWALYDEALPWSRLVGFGLVWAAVAHRHGRRRPQHGRAAGGLPYPGGVHRLASRAPPPTRG